MCNKKFNYKGKLLCIILLAFCLTGCMEETVRAQEKEGKEVFRQYAEENLPGAKITYISIRMEMSHMGACLTDYVEGEFIYEETKHKFVVNTVSGEVYTSILVDELKEKGTAYVLDTLGISCDKIVENRWIAGYCVPARKEDPDNVFEGKKINLGCVLPVSFDIENDLEEILDNENCNMHIYLSYAGDEGLNPDGYDITVMSGLESLDIRHLKDNEDQIRAYQPVDRNSYSEGVYEYMLKEHVVIQPDRVVYSQWAEYEKEYVILAYEYYKRECEGKDVTETIAEAGTDIQIAVGKDRIGIRGNKVNYYLLNTDLNVAKAQDRIVIEKTLNTGKVIYEDYQWLWDGDRYVCGKYEPVMGCVRGEDVYYLGDAAQELIRSKKLGDVAQKMIKSKKMD